MAICGYDTTTTIGFLLVVEEVLFFSPFSLRSTPIPSSSAMFKLFKYGTTKIGFPTISCSIAGPGSKYLTSPRNLLMTIPTHMSQSLSGKHALVPTICANTPPGSILATSSQGHFNFLTSGRLTISLSIKFNSVQLPAPSKTIICAFVTWCSC